MKLLIQDIDINLVDSDGCTPIFYAARAGSTGTAKFLIAHGADLKVKDSKGCTPLSYAAGADVNNQKRLELLKLLIKGTGLKQDLNRSSAFTKLSSI